MRQVAGKKGGAGAKAGKQCGCKDFWIFTRTKSTDQISYQLMENEMKG